jgi:hypothetical protein
MRGAVDQEHNIQRGQVRLSTRSKKNGRKKDGIMHQLNVRTSRSQQKSNRRVRFQDKQGEEREGGGKKQRTRWSHDKSQPNDRLSHSGRYHRSHTGD